MRWYERFGQKHRRFGIENLMLYISISMVIVYVMEYIFSIPIINLISLNREGLLRGQLWRLLTFIMIPASSSPIWLILGCYTYYSIGKSLENFWGKAVFNLYYIIGMLSAIIAALVLGSSSNTFINLSLFLALACINPDAMFIYYIIPIKAKYLAILNVVVFLLDAIRVLLSFGLPSFVLVVLNYMFSLTNFIVFFAPDFFRTIKLKVNDRKRKEEFQRNIRGGR